MAGQAGDGTRLEAGMLNRFQRFLVRILIGKSIFGRAYLKSGDRIIVRQAKVSDLLGITAVFKSEAKRSADLGQFSALNDGSGDFVVALNAEDQQIVAYGSRSENFIQILVRLPEDRWSGSGHHVLSRLEQHIRKDDHKFEEILVYVYPINPKQDQEKLICFYKRRGYQAKPDSQNYFLSIASRTTKQPRQRQA